MGFFKKLFRFGGKKGKQNDSNETKTNGGGARGKKISVQTNLETETGNVGNHTIGKGGASLNHRSATDGDTPISTTSKGKSSAASRRSGRADLSDGSQRPVLSPRNEVVSSTTSATFVGTSFSSGAKKDGSTPTGSSGSAPVDLDESIGTDNISSHSIPRIEPMMKRDENRQQLLLPTEALEGYGITPPAAPTRYDFQSNELPKTFFSAGQINVGGSDDLQSDGESSSFNLSTDAEDTEYEALRRRIGGMPANSGNGAGGAPNTAVSSILHTNNASSIIQKPSLQLSILDTSDVSQHYNTDGEGSVFPNLPTDDEATMTESQSGSVTIHTRSLLGGAPYPDPEDEHDVLRGQRMDTTSRAQSAVSTKPGPADDPHAWNPESITAKMNTKLNTDKEASFNRSYNAKFMESVYGSSTKLSAPKSPKSHRSPRTEFSSPNNIDGTPTSNDNFGFADDPFADFADFATFETKFGDFDKNATTSESFSQVANSLRGFTEEKDEKHAALSRKYVSSRDGNEIMASSSASAVHNETSLSELLAQAKSKTTRNGSNARRSGSSVNSAPLITTSYLRQQHNLNPGRQNSNTVSDIIQSLEAANASRIRSTSNGRSTNFLQRESSGSSRDGTIPAFRAARERARRRREREERRLNGVGSQEAHSSDEELEEDNRLNESWLFKEVEDTLGPRGIAADLESLSGRSNRSNSSRGNRSHKSHRSHRSHKSRTSTGRRRQPAASGGSGDSVDSHGEKSHGSRRSRSSRYSHKSARSYISQMSEQSRSVANDLLRLEMQLKMVGSGTNELGDGSTGGDRSIGGRSASRGSTARPSGNRSSRSVTSAARRSRITVTAPPGKLGIILVNKADSKGTVVSGVRTSSVLADKVHPGDRIVAIDGEDVSHMSVSEITTIMSRKSEFERMLTILTTPRHSLMGSDVQDINTANISSMGSPLSPGRMSYSNINN